MRCFIKEVNSQPTCVCGEFKDEPGEQPCYQQLEGQSGAAFSKNLAVQALDYFQSSGILTLFVFSAGIIFVSSRFD
jgi:hypothetical protein